MKHKDFYTFVEIIYNYTKINGKVIFVMKENLKVLKKKKLKEWNNKVFGILDFKVIEAIKLLSDSYHLIGENCVDVDCNLVAYQRSKASNKVWEDLNL